MAPDGRLVPVNVEPSASGTLMFNESLGWLVRAHETNQGHQRYASHLLECKALARALHTTKTISLRPVGASCDVEGCEFTGKHTHVRCFNCGEVGHYASDCENASEVKELVFE